MLFLLAYKRCLCRIPRHEMIRLYRQIFHAHRSFLPPHLRFLGNEYVRNEWQQHKNADAKFVVKFYSVSCFSITCPCFCFVFNSILLLFLVLFFCCCFDSNIFNFIFVCLFVRRNGEFISIQFCHKVCKIVTRKTFQLARRSPISN